MARVLRARAVLPIERPPIDGGWVAIESGRIAAVGGGTPPGPAEDAGDVALLPALVNAHTHLELSWMAGRVPPAAAMNEWIRALVQLRRRGASGGRGAEQNAARVAASSLVETGTILVGDISNTLMTPAILREAGLGGVVFHELLAFAPPDPARLVREAWERATASETPAAPSAAPPVRCSVVAHAPYSASPALIERIGHQAGDAPLAIHLAESSEEIEFLHTGRGPIREMLEALGTWTGTWEPPRCGPVEYIDRLGYLRPGTLVVHGVHLTNAELERLRERDAVLVTCARSNVWVGAGLPPVSRFYGEGLRVAVGTDSLASVESLDLFAELAEIRRIAPEVEAARLLDSATRAGAEALGFDTAFGTLAPGKRAVIVAVDLPASVNDVEEYLVSGVPPGRVRRVA